MMKMNVWATAVLAGCVSMSAFADISQFGASAGWMHVYENNAGAQGGYLWGSGWGVADNQALTTDDATFELLPNINCYNPEDSYWSDGAGDGNKWMEANTYREYTLAAGETAATMSYTVSAYDLDARYSLQAFVKILDPDSGYATTYSDFAPITAVAGSVELTVDDATVVEGDILQFGFVMNGLNANPADDWGSATVTIDSINVVPEPATLGLLAVAGITVLGFRRRFRS